MSAIFSKPKAPSVIAPPPVATDEDPEVVAAAEEAARKERELARKRKGRASTILTGPEGLGSSMNPSSSNLKTLLGG